MRLAVLGASVAIALAMVRPLSCGSHRRGGVKEGAADGARRGVQSGRRDRARAKGAGSPLEWSSQRLSDAQAKVCYIGPQSRPIWTVIFCRKGQKVKMQWFYAVQPGGGKYNNDELNKRFTVTSREFHRMLRAVASVLSSEDVANAPELLSFVVVRKAAGKPEGRDYRVGAASARAFYQRLIGGLDAKNNRGRAELARQFSTVVTWTGDW